MPKGLDGFIWCYTLFNVRFDALINEFKNQLTVAHLDYDQLVNPGYVTNHIGELRKVYRQLGKKPTRGSTSINLNSLLVMSYPKDQENCHCFDYRTMVDYFCDWPVRRSDVYNGSCLYTGDTSANDPVVWQKIIQMIALCLGQDNKLMALQVPHHGSKYSYDQNLLDSDKFSNGFMNYDPYYKQHIFDDNLPMTFAAKEKPLLLVTREYGSQFEEYYRLS